MKRTGKTQVPGMYKVKEGVVINKDKDALKMYKKQKAKMKRLDTLEEEMGEIKTSLSEIKEMLKGLVK
jgi:hypothetical protein